MQIIIIHCLGYIFGLGLKEADPAKQGAKDVPVWAVPCLHQGG